MTILSFLGSIFLLIYFGASDQYIDDNGWLVEEFWALALGTLALFLSGLSALTYLVLFIVRRRKGKTSVDS
jgi:hypothetical protein